jgi:DNA-binding winged helix-turn-helix (wHTH) protein
MFSGQYGFAGYRLDAQSGMLFREGDHVALPPKVAELLVALVQAAGTVLTREELLQRLWPDTVVEEGSLTSHISLLRKALGERPKAQDFIETLPKRGYRFVASVKRLAPGVAESGVDRTMLVVLPFENLTAGERYDYFSEGLTEEMITELARLSPESLGVIARTSAMQFKSTTKNIAQIGSERMAEPELVDDHRPFELRHPQRIWARRRLVRQALAIADLAHQTT